MTTIVKHRRTGNEYILLSINGEAGKANPSRFISELFNQDKSEVSCSATVCDVQGNMFLAYIDDLVVTQINGKKPAEILPEPIYQEANDYPEQSSDFEDEELEEELDNAQDSTSAEPKTSFVYGQGSSAQSNINHDSDNDDDWI